MSEAVFLSPPTGYPSLVLHREDLTEADRATIRLAGIRSLVRAVAEDKNDPANFILRQLWPYDLLGPTALDWAITISTASANANDWKNWVTLSVPQGYYFAIIGVRNLTSGRIVGLRFRDPNAVYAVFSLHGLNTEFEDPTGYFSVPIVVKNLQTIIIDYLATATTPSGATDRLVLFGFAAVDKKKAEFQGQFDASRTRWYSL